MNHYQQMHHLYLKYGFFDEPLTLDKLKFRAQLLLEEANELLDAINNKDADEVVDALIDAEVIATGTIALLHVDGEKAWEEVYKANANKIRGVKAGREQSKGWDLTKNKDWIKPNHKDNVGVLNDIFKK